MTSALIYLFAVLAANFTATLFIPCPWFGVLAVGTFVFGITFTQRDRMHAFKGRRYVYWVILITAFANFLMMKQLANGWGASLSEWAYSQGYNWFGEGMGYLAETSIRVYIASCVAILLGEAANTEVYHKLRERSWMVRVMRSNAVSIPIDTLLFTLIAFWGEPSFTPKFLFALICGDMLVKFVVSTIYALSRPREPQEFPGLAPAVSSTD